jgi:hypothetical protein
MIHFTESDLLAADDAERNNTCPVCGGWPTCYREAPHRCNECDLPVVHWQPWREMQTKIEQLTAERDRLNHAIATLISKSHQQAGNLQNPYAWIAQRDWEEFVRKVDGEH